MTSWPQASSPASRPSRIITPRRARVAADHHRAAGFQERAESGGEIQHVRGGKRGADHAAQAHMGDTQRFGGSWRYHWASFSRPNACGT